MAPLQINPLVNITPEGTIFASTIEKTLPVMSGKNLFITYILFSFLLLTTSCATTYIVGQDFDDSKVSSLIIGKSNKSQVIERFGQPLNKGQVNQYTAFIYSYEEDEFPPSSTKVYVNKKQKSLMILFDENDVVKYFTHNMPLSFSTAQLIMFNEEKIKKQQNSENIDY